MRRVEVRIGRILARINLVFVVLAAAVIVRVLVQAAPSPRQAPGYHLGDLVVLPGVSFSSADHTLLFYVLHDAVDRYRTLLEGIANRRSTHLRFVVLTDDAAMLAKDLRAISVSADSVVHVAVSATKITTNPTVLLVDQGGRVERRWLTTQFAQGSGQAALLDELVAVPERDSR